ncbi:hypothetical protein B0H14DRAFT_2573235 [Mycena olivaceomarginata]|nr:hypothetical protein B0H14DRAFT_2573235 [Mycena olivaceomarginata]
MSFNADLVLGALLVGTWANSILYTIEIVQLLVSSAIVFDSVSMIANYTGVYLNQYWPDSLYVFTTGVVGALAQSFLAGRYWRLSRNRFITPTLFFFIMVAIGGAFASGATLAIFPEYKDRKKVIIPATTWLVTSAVTDISIAVALLLEFRKVKSSFKETKGLLKRLVAQTVQTGAAGATVALAILVAFLAKKESNISTGIGYCIGHVYCITMVRTTVKKSLANLNSRKAGKTWSGNDTSSGAITQLRGERENQELSGGGDEYGGIRSFKTKRLPDNSPAVEMERIVNDSASYSSKNKQDLC